MGVLSDVKVRANVLLNPNLKRQYLKEFEFTKVTLTKLMASVDDLLESFKNQPPVNVLKNALSDYCRSLQKREFEEIPLFEPYNAFLYGLTLLTKPLTAVETGVERGASTFVILSAMRKNGFGTLYSIDRTPTRFKLYGFKPSPVAQPLTDLVDTRVKWEFRLGMSTVELLKLPDTTLFDLFIAGSAHTYENQSFETKFGWKHLKSGGFCIVDRPDYPGNDFRFWREAQEEFKPSWSWLLPESSYPHFKDYQFGVMQKA